MTLDLLTAPDRVPGHQLDRPDGVLGARMIARDRGRVRPGRGDRSVRAPLQRARHGGPRRRRPDPRREQVRARPRGHRRDARASRATTASSPSRFPRRCGSPRPTTTSCSATRPSTAPRSPRSRPTSAPRRASPSWSTTSRSSIVVDAVAAPARAPTMRVAIDADASWRAPASRPHRRAPLARARPGRGREPRARDRRPPGLPARRADDVRGADRGAGRRDGLRGCRHPLDAAPVRGRAARAPRRDRRRAARHRAPRVRQRRRHGLARARRHPISPSPS